MSENFKIVRTEKYNIRISELCRTGYVDDPSSWEYEWNYVGSIRTAEKIGNTTAGDMSDADLITHYQNNKRVWGSR